MNLRLFAFVFLLYCSLGNSQIRHPKASPFSTVEQEVGLSKIIVKYSRPAVRGRHIYGTRPDGFPGLVPNGRIWRVGANESTKITIDTDMKVLGNNLPQGTYALYAFPNDTSWEVVFHKNTEHWGDGRTNYNPEEDVFRVEVVPEKIASHQENFLISFDSITHNSIHMQWIWADTRVSIPFEVDTAAQMEKEMTRQITENPTAQTYYEAARYLQEQDIEYERALNYLNKALELGGDTYYFHRVKSLVQAKLGYLDEAIKSAKKSLEIADQLGKDEFVRMNQLNIDTWSMKVKQ